MSRPYRRSSYVLTYTVNFAPFPPFVWVLIHLWSLSVEEQFYLMWPLVMKIARRPAFIAVAILAVFANPVVHAFHKFGGLLLPGYGPFPLVCGPIAMGCLVAIWAGELRRLIVSSKFLSDSRVLLFTILLVAVLDAVPQTSASTVLLVILTNSLLTFCVARLVFIPTGMLGHVLNSAPLVLVGKLSYSLYLWQELFLNPNRPSHPPIPAPFPADYLLIFAAASASYWGLEVRFLGLRKKYRNAAAAKREAPG